MQRKLLTRRADPVETLPERHATVSTRRVPPSLSEEGCSVEKMFLLQAVRGHCLDQREQGASIIQQHLHLSDDLLLTLAGWHPQRGVGTARCMVRSCGKGGGGQRRHIGLDGRLSSADVQTLQNIIAVSAPCFHGIRRQHRLTIVIGSVLAPAVILLQPGFKKASVRCRTSAPSSVRIVDGYGSRPSLVTRSGTIR